MRLRKTCAASRCASLLWGVATAGIALLSCVPTLSIENAGCPCAEGWTCCKALQRCLRNGVSCPAADAGGEDRALHDGGEDRALHDSGEQERARADVNHDRDAGGTDLGAVDTSADVAVADRRPPDAQIEDVGAPATRPCSHWSFEEVPGAHGDEPALALGNDALPLIVYFDAGDPRLARGTASGWQLDAVDQPAIFGGAAAVAVDPSGALHVAFKHEVEHRYAIRVGGWAGGRWEHGLVHTSGTGPAFTSMRLDPQGKPHLSFRDNANGNVLYASATEARWEVEVVAQGLSTAHATTSLALQADRPFVAYFDPRTGDLMLARPREVEGGWDLELVEGDGDGSSEVGAYCSLALDSSDRPHISYRDMADKSLRYAYHDGQSWQRFTVPGTGVGLSTALSLGADGAAHLSYHDDNVDGVGHARGEAGTDPAGWSKTTVWTGSSSFAGQHVTQALDASGCPHLAFAGDDEAIVYAHR